MRQLNRAKGKPHVKMGWPFENAETSEIHKDSELRNVDLAFIHEFGSAKVPERSFLRSTFDEKRSSMIKFTKEVQAGVFRGQLTIKSALQLLGEKMILDTKNKIRSGIAPPLAASTIRRRKGKKGNETPLIDTAQLINSITTEVNE